MTKKGRQCIRRIPLWLGAWLQKKFIYPECLLVEPITLCPRP